MWVCFASNDVGCFQLHVDIPLVDIRRFSDKLKHGVFKAPFEAWRGILAVQVFQAFISHYGTLEFGFPLMNDPGAIMIKDWMNLMAKSFHSSHSSTDSSKYFPRNTIRYMN